MAVDYFTKWDKAIPTYSKDRKLTDLFIFNHIIARFRIPKSIVTDHGSHFQNMMMPYLSEKLGFHHDNSIPYYPHANVQVESINKVLKTMLERMVEHAKSN